MGIRLGVTSLNEIFKLVKFGLVGIFNTLAGYALFLLFHLVLSFGPSTANSLSYLIMISIAFVLYEGLVFGHRPKNRGRSIALYVGAAFFAFLCNLGCLNLLMSFGMKPIVAQVGAMVCYSVVFYLTNRLIVFSDASSQSD